MESGDDVVFRIRPKDLTWREVDGEIIALDLVSSTYFTTNQTGAHLWRLLIEGATLAQMSEWLVRTYAVTGDAASDASAFVDLLRSHSLLDLP